MIGIEELAPQDRLIVQRARRLERYLTQPFHVTEEHTGMKGVPVPLEITVKDFETILAGKLDNVPEDKFYMIGSGAGIAP